MARNQILYEGPFSYVAAADIAANLLVVLDTTGKAAVAGAGSKPFAVCYDGATKDGYGTFDELCGVALIKAGAAIAIGDYVKAGANGKLAPEAVVTTPTAFTLGQALTAAAQDGDLILVQCNC